MPNFNAYGTLASIACETFDRFEQEGDAWDFFLKSAEGSYPDIFPTYEEVESEEYRRHYPCEDLDFRVYQNIIRGNEILKVGYCYVCDDLFRFLDTFEINEIRVSWINYSIKKLSSLFQEAGWVLRSVSNAVKEATFKRQ